MAKCKGKTTRGPCKAQALQGGRYCFTHDPASGKARATARKLGGMRNRTPHAGQADILPATVTTISDATKILDYTLAEIIPMENSIARGRLLIALVAGWAIARFYKACDRRRLHVMPYLIRSLATYLHETKG